MAKKGSLAEELKALGSEMASAFKQMKNSEEFKGLEKEIAKSVKGVSANLMKSLKAAKNSQETAKLKKRMGRVVKMGAAKGNEQARKAAHAGLKKFSAAMKKLHKSNAN